jgi:hypothetical protein
MITERDDLRERKEDRTTLVWSLLVSGFANLMAWMLLAWVIALRTHVIVTMQQQAAEVITVTSSSLNIAKGGQPARARSKPQQAPRRVIPQPQAQPTELARITPNGTPVPRSAPRKQQAGSLAEQLAQQQVAFQHEADQLNAQSTALAIATIDPNQAGNAHQPFQMEVSGLPGEPRRGEGTIDPTRQWFEGGLDCYYAQYMYHYPDGHTEDGQIPWQMCFPRRSDPFLRGRHSMPMPLPMPGYRLPAGVALTPLEQETYDYYLSQQNSHQ